MNYDADALCVYLSALLAIFLLSSVYLYQNDNTIMQLTVMTKGGVQVYFQLVFVKKLIVSRRVTTRTGAFHTAKILRPSRPTSIFFQPLFFRPPTETMMMQLITITNSYF